MHMTRKPAPWVIWIGLLTLTGTSGPSSLSAQTLPGSRSVAAPEVNRMIEALSRETGVDIARIKRLLSEIQKVNARQNTAIASNEADIATLMTMVRDWADRIATVEAAIAAGGKAPDGGSAFLDAIDQGRLDEAMKYFSEFERASVRAYYQQSWAGIMADLGKDRSATKDSIIAMIEQYVAYYPVPENIDEARALYAKLISERDEVLRLEKLRTPWLAGNRQMTLPMFQSAVTDLVFSPDMKLLAVGETNGQVTLFDTGNWRSRIRIMAHEGAVTSLHFSTDSRYLVTSGIDTFARSWLVSTGRKVQDFAGHREAVNSARFSPDNNLVLTASSDEKVLLWNPRNGAVVSTLVDESDCKRLDREQAGNLRRDDGCRFGSWQEPKRFADFNRDGTRILVQGRSVAGQYEYPSGAFGGHPASGKRFAHMAIGPHRYAPHANIYYSRGNVDDMGALIDGATNRQICSLPREGVYGTKGLSADFARDAKLIAVGTSDNVVALFNSEDCTARAHLTGPALPVEHVSLAADGRSVAAAAGNRVLLWFDLSQPATAPTSAQTITRSVDGKAD